MVLPLLKTDLFTILKAVREERLSELDIQWSDGAAACVILASGGYPKKYETGFPIQGLDEKGEYPGVVVYHAGTKRQDGRFLTAGGRVLGITGLGKDLSQALEKAYGAVKTITFERAHYRTDIGKK